MENVDIENRISFYKQKLYHSVRVQKKIHFEEESRGITSFMEPNPSTLNERQKLVQEMEENRRRYLEHLYHEIKEEKKEVMDEERTERLVKKISVVFGR